MAEPIVDSEADIDQQAADKALTVRLLEGPNWLGSKPIDENDEVKELLGPLTPREVPIIRCTGLNYRSDSKFQSHLEKGYHTNTKEQFSNRIGIFLQTQHYSSCPDKP
jgi:hypothetical protein